MSNGEMRDIAPIEPSPERGPVSPSSPEKEKVMERPTTEEKAKAKAPAPAPVAVAPAPAMQMANGVPATKDPDLMKVERVLEDNLSDIFFKLPVDTRTQFKAKGEETATKINQLMESAKVKARTVLDLIRDWLKLIPGVNRFFLEQEAKIKTDRIVALGEQRRRDKGLS
jgi:hypothetical protein